MSVTAVPVGTRTSNDQLRAMMQKSADENAKKQADGKASATAAPATTGAPTSSLVPQNAAKVTASAVVATQNEPSSSNITCKDGSVEAENVGMATGMAHAAREDIETLNLGMSLYNGAKTILANTAQLDDFRQVYGDEATQQFTEIMKRQMASGIQLMTIGLHRMHESSVTGTVVTQDSDGSFKPGQYTQERSGAGWSVSVKSTGEAKAIANGVDVSDKVSNESSTGFNWAEEIAKHQAASPTAEEPRGSNNIDAVLKLLEQARTSLDAFVERARKALADYAPSQQDAPAKAPGVDVAA